MDRVEVVMVRVRVVLTSCLLAGNLQRIVTIQISSQIVRARVRNSDEKRNGNGNYTNGKPYNSNVQSEAPGSVALQHNYIKHITRKSGNLFTRCIKRKFCHVHHKINKLKLTGLTSCPLFLHYFVDQQSIRIRTRVLRNTIWHRLNGLAIASRQFVNVRTNRKRARERVRHWSASLRTQIESTHNWIIRIELGEVKRASDCAHTTNTLTLELC